MTDAVKKACDAYEKILIEGTEYTGNSEAKKKIISASQLGNDDLQIYLKYVNGSKHKSEYTAATVGSIYQLGVDKCFEGRDGYVSAYRMKYDLPNGWTVSGECDQIDLANKVIFDNKVTTATSIASTIKDGKNSGYGLQMGVYKFLLYEEAIAAGKEPIEFTAVLPMVDKGFSYFKKPKYNQLTFVEVETYSIEDIKQMLIDKSDKIQEYIDMEVEPPQCTNLFWYAEKGKARKPMRCIHYCDQVANCKHYQTTGDPRKKYDHLMGL